MNKINWGIIGCGDVTEVKSGPAFNKVNNSALVAVMRRDAVKAEDYARRHNVPRWYNNAEKLIIRGWTSKGHFKTQHVVIERERRRDVSDDKEW